MGIPHVHDFPQIPHDCGSEETLAGGGKGGRGISGKDHDTLGDQGARLRPGLKSGDDEQIPLVGETAVVMAPPPGYNNEVLYNTAAAQEESGIFRDLGPSTAGQTLMDLKRKIQPM